MSSTSPQAVVWVIPGTNLMQTVFYPANTQDIPAGQMWTLASTSNYYDLIFEVNGMLFRCTSLFINGIEITNDANFTPQLDIPYTFTDTNAPPDHGFYRVLPQ